MIALALAATWGGVKLFSHRAPTPVVPVTVQASPSPVAEAPKPVPTHTPEKGDRLKEEAALVEKARQELATDPFVAFRLLEQHRHQFTDGQLAEERDALTIEALGKLGRTGEQQRRAALFLKHHATSPYADRVRQSVEKR